MSQLQMQTKMSNTIRFLAADMVQRANSGHPGMPMGLADIMTVFSEYYRHNPKNSKWLNRDRVVFSGGHGSALIYSMLHLWGYDLSIDDLKNFRQLDSKTPGHPESTHTDGIEVTTGPLGQGVANAVGFSMASQHASHLLNSDEAKFIDHKVYCFCGDGDLEEGISYEACSMAGHNNCDNLVLIYDSNNITIEGDTDISISENIELRFTSQGWDVITIDGHNFNEITNAFESAQKQTKPLLIIAKTKIGRGAATMEGSHHTHGAPLGEEELKASKEKAGCSIDSFVVPEDVKVRFSSILEKGDLLEREWNKRVISAPLKEQNTMLERLQNPNINSIDYPTFSVGESFATRDTNHKILNAIAKALPNFIGGSADLAPSNKTNLDAFGDFPKGKNIHFGIREHSMAAITTAMAQYGLFMPFCATFFIFSDYLKPSARVAALMKAQLFYVFTHDSIGVGEDGGTHQPIEQLGTFRAIPDSYTFRPADGVENIEAWINALTLQAPSAFVLSRQKLPILNRDNMIGDMAKGAYLISPSENPTITLIATGSEVELALNTKALLEADGISTNVVSAPCYELLCEQENSYVNEIIDPDTKVIAIEAATALEWYKFADEIIAMNDFGASAPAGQLFQKYGFSAENIASKIKSL
jgi:transketolase